MSDEELYFSDDEEQSKQVKIEFVEGKKEKRGGLREKSVLIDKQERSDGMKVKQEASISAKKIKFEQGPTIPNLRSNVNDLMRLPQPNVQDSQSIIQIQRDQFYKLYFEYCTQFHLVRPSIDISFTPFLKHVYSKIMDDLRHRQFNEKSNSFIFTIRTFIMRHTLEQFKLRERQLVGAKTEIIDLEEVETRRLRKRNAKENKRVQLPELPGEMSLQDVGVSFKNGEFAAFFKTYLQTGEMKRSILHKNYSEVQEFCEEIESIHCKRSSLKAKKEEFNSLRKPMMLSEVDLYFAEANAIMNHFCS